MSDAPFALEWTYSSVVFGHARKMQGHDFYETEKEMRDAAERLKVTEGMQQIVYYQRIDSSLQAIGQWPLARERKAALQRPDRTNKRRRKSQ